MTNTKRILELHNKKEEVKLQQRELLTKYGFIIRARDTETQIRKATGDAFYKMFESKNENSDYDKFIELEMDYVSFNKELLQLGMTHQAIIESR